MSDNQTHLRNMSELTDRCLNRPTKNKHTRQAE